MDTSKGHIIGISPMMGWTIIQKSNILQTLKSKDGSI